MLSRILLLLCISAVVVAEPNCSWALPANVSQCPTVCTPRCTLNETVTCVNSTCSDHASCALNCTGVTYSNVSCPACTAHPYALDCNVDCTVNCGMNCEWDCVPVSNCAIPLPELVCEPYGCAYSAAGRSLPVLLLSLFFV